MLHLRLNDVETTSVINRVVIGYGPSISERKFHRARFPGIFLNNYFKKHLVTTASQNLALRFLYEGQRNGSNIQRQSFTGFIKNCYREKI